VDSPYRSAPGVQTAQRPRDAGIVGDIIEQFADRYAFYRELIQNSIDANTESIEVELRYDDAGGTLTVAVEDRGDGMSREIIEDGLLVLFRSTKEKDESKIGKFGVGFVSVLAVQPRVVRVISSFGGTRHTLHLYPDFSYELFDSGRTKRTGTTVELEIPMKSEKVEDFVMASWEALNRWCRHATVMISLTAAGPGGGTILNERVDRPLSLDQALASVERATTDGSISAVVGLTTVPYSAFFNHGLLLYETREPLVGNLSFVIQDARLGHTLSRDNVRRDKHYERALGFVHDLGQSLESEIIRCMQDALHDPDPGPYQVLARTVHRRGIAIDHRAWPLPLMNPHGDRLTTDREAFLATGGWTANRRSPLTAALAEANISVVNRSRATATDYEESDWWFSDLPEADRPGSRPSKDDDAAWFSELCADEREVHDHLTLVTPVTPTDFDLLLLDKLSRLLEEVFRRPSRIILARLEGDRASALAVAGGHEGAFVGHGPDRPWILDQEGASRNPFRILRRPALVLNANSTKVEVARRRAKTEPYVAAETLARLLLLDREKLDENRSETLLVNGLDELLRGNR
jgi:molecular chaperone HtpG